MVRMAAKLLFVALALFSAPVDASRVQPAGAPYGAGVSLAETLANLPEPLPEETFFELINAARTPGYLVGSKQLDTQIMVIALSTILGGDPASPPPADLSDTFNLDSFFSDAAGTYLLGIDDWASSTWLGSSAYDLDIDPAAVGDELTTVADAIDIGSDRDSDWYDFTIDDGAALALETVQPGAPDFDTEMWLYDSAGALGGCADDSSHAACGAAGRVFNGVLDLAKSCAEEDSPACTLFSQIGPQILGPGDYHVRVAYTSFFPADAAPGDYTLDIDVGAGLSSCIDSPGAAGCAQLFDIVAGIHDYNSLCTADPAPTVCDGRALGTPDDTEIQFHSGLIAEGTPPVSGLSPGDWVLIDLDGDLQTRGDQTTTTIVGIIENQEDPSTGAPPAPIPADYNSSCSLDRDDPACLAAGDIALTATELFAECLGNDAGICPRLLERGDRYLSIDLFPGEPGDYIFHIDVDPSAIEPCRADPSLPGCDGAARLQDAFQDYVTGCDSSPSSCGGPAPVADAGASTGPDATGAPSTTSGARSITVTPGNDPGHFVLRETGDSTGIFRVSEEFGYSFSVTRRDYVQAIFATLPPGGILETDRYRVRLAPDGKALLLRDDAGRPFTYPTDGMAPDGTLVPLQADISNPDFTILTGGGARIVIPSPFAAYVNLNNDPSAIATTPDEIAAATSGEGADLLGLITAKGGSTGEVFDIRLLNMGKPTLVEGDAVFEPLDAEEADAVRGALAGLMDSVNSVTDVDGTGYCLEQDKTVPSAGEVFRLANAGKSAEFRFAQGILAAARAVEAQGLLNPDSDPDDYVHSTRQWALWSAEKGYDKEGFTNSFLEHSRKVLEANGTQWSPQIEDVIRGLVDNRWNDVRQVLSAAGMAPAGADAMAGRNAVSAALGLLFAALLSVAISSPTDRGTPPPRRAGRRPGLERDADGAAEEFHQR